MNCWRVAWRVTSARSALPMTRRSPKCSLEAGLERPELPRAVVGGRKGHHSEHLGHLLAQMQFLPRTYPDATW